MPAPVALMEEAEPDVTHVQLADEKPAATPAPRIAAFLVDLDSSDDDVHDHGHNVGRKKMLHQATRSPTPVDPRTA